MTLVVAFCCWEPWLARKTAAECCFSLVAAGGESCFARKKLGWGTPLVACCCWEPWLARKTIAERCYGLVAAGENPGWPGKTRLVKEASRCLLLLGNLVSQKMLHNDAAGW